MDLKTKRERYAYLLGCKEERFKYMKRMFCIVCDARIDESRRSDTMYCTPKCKREADKTLKDAEYL
jgi:hypothetical protein